MNPIEYISYKQEFLKDLETTFTQVEAVCKLYFAENTFRIEIPNSHPIGGFYEFQGNEDGQNIYRTDKGCMLWIGMDKVSINLFPTHGICWVFFLPNYVEPSFSEKVLSELNTTYQYNKKNYGELVANCALERKVVLGLKFTEVITILGASNDILFKKVNDVLEIMVTIYDDYYIVMENSIVVYVKQIKI